MGPSCLFSEFHGDNPETGAGAGREAQMERKGRGGDQGRGDPTPWKGPFLHLCPGVWLNDSRECSV